MSDIEPSADFDAEALEAGRRLFTQDCAFIIGCAGIDQVPDTGLPEIAFAGRSNVGKSSLINALVGRKALARTSNSPGRTQQINFFDLGRRMTLADLPGYGYAKAPKGEIKKWTGLTRTYLKGRAELRRICLLIDSRHGLKDSDRGVMTALDKAAQPYQVVLTKCDKIKPGPLRKLIGEIGEELASHPAAHPEIMSTSSKSGAGVAALRAALATLAD